MANIKSAEKANRQRIKRTARNMAQKTAMRTIIKRLRTAIGNKSAKEAQTMLDGRHPDALSVPPPMAIAHKILMDALLK